MGFADRKKNRTGNDDSKLTRGHRTYLPFEFAEVPLSSI